MTFTTLGGGLADEFFGEYRVGVCCFSHQLCSDFSHIVKTQLYGMPQLPYVVYFCMTNRKYTT